MTGYIYARNIVEQQVSPSPSSYHIITTKSDINNSKIYKIMLCLYDQRKLILKT